MKKFLKVIQTLKKRKPNQNLGGKIIFDIKNKNISQKYQKEILVYKYSSVQLSDAIFWTSALTLQ